tara:strand:+ start:305 stop:478 length:174 start_codon:yes stop_codon:yes gene_type:complete
MYDDEVEIGFVVSVLNQEIEYATSCLQPHDTGHIHTAISWMKERVRDLEEDLKLSKK